MATRNCVQQQPDGQKRLAEQQESCHIKAEILNASDEQSPPSKDTSSIDDVTAIAAGNDSKSLQTHIVI